MYTHPLRFESHRTNKMLICPCAAVSRVLGSRDPMHEPLRPSGVPRRPMVKLGTVSHLSHSFRPHDLIHSFYIRQSSCHLDKILIKLLITQSTFHKPTPATEQFELPPEPCTVTADQHGFVRHSSYRPDGRPPFKQYHGCSCSSFSSRLAAGTTHNHR